MEKITLVKDNNFGVFDNESKRKVTIEIAILTYEIKRYFKWLSPTKRYNTFVDRLFALGSHEYDKFINYLIKKGY